MELEYQHGDTGATHLAKVFGKTTILFRLQLYSILKSDWSGAWLLLPVVTQTMNSIVSTGYSRKIVLMRVKWNLFSKSCTQPKIIGLDSIPTAVRYRIEDNEELESST